MEQKNLWGNLPLEENTKTPLILLREQASILTKLTDGLLEGAVDVTKTSNGGFLAILKIIAPALDRYSHTILFIRYDITLYPLVFSDRVNDTSYQIQEENEFTSKLSEVLASKAVHKIISALITQSKTDDDSF